LRGEELINVVCHYDDDLLIAWRRRVHPGDPEGRGAAWLADYDAISPDVLGT
jgi:hypothetical protein